MAKLSHDDFGLEIFWFTGGNCLVFSAGGWSPGYNHFSIEVGNKQRFCERLARESGVKIIKIERSGSYTYFIKDPDGNLIEVREPPK